MSHSQQIAHLGADPEGLELAYQRAANAEERAAFAAAIDDHFAAEPDNLLYAAWHYRLRHAVAERGRRAIAWAWALPLALLNGLWLWWLSDDGRFMLYAHTLGAQEPRSLIPHILLLWAPVSAAFVLLYLTLAGRGRWARLLAILAGLGALTGYAVFTYPQLGPYVFQEQYTALMALHLPLAAWAAVGLFLLLGSADAGHRFAFLIKSLEVGIMAGLFVIAGGLFTGITFGLFAALGMEPTDVIVRLFIAGGGGLIPVIAVALIYDPQAGPAAQSFEEGLSKLIAMLMRIMLPLTLLVLVVYLAFIPANLYEPYRNRDVLIVYNAMLFAVMALLVGATPVRSEDLPARIDGWLRRGLVTVAALALVVGVYALSAIGYRTWQGQLTPNRLAFIGWNVINIAILLLLLIRQAQAGRADWLPQMQRAFATGALAYVGWTLVVILATPWLFGANRQGLDTAPPEIQTVAYESTGPVLLKCTDSPHIYLLENGEKRWVKDIPTFEAEGYVWDDVSYVSCPALRALPDGPPLPRDAGSPPQP